MKRRAAVMVLFATACSVAEGPSGSPVKTINVSVTPSSVTVGGAARATASILDAQGNVLADRSPVWTSLQPAVVTVTGAGDIIALQAGTATVRATDGGVKGDAVITVHNVVAASVVLSRDTATISIPNGAVQLIVTAKDANGTVISNPAISWQSIAPLIATVNGAGLVSGVAVGKTTITASVDGVVARTSVAVTVTPNAAAPTIALINPPTLRPGGTYTLTGTNFAASAAGNAIVVDGVPVTVGQASATSLAITLPSAGFSCDPTRAVFVQITANGAIGGGSAPLQVATLRTLAPGQSIVVTNPAEVRCNEVPQTGGRYVVSVYNAYRASVTPVATGGAAFFLRGAAGIGSGTIAAQPPLMQRIPQIAVPAIGGAAFDAAARAERVRARERAHMSVLDRNIRYLRANAAIGATRSISPAPARASQLATVGSITTVKLPNLDAANFCVSSIPVGGRTVFVGQHSIILEDTLQSFNGQPTLHGQMDSYFTQIGQEFDAVMWPILTANFGNPLALDAQLSGTGKVVMVFSPRVNTLEGGAVLGFTASCDLTPATAPSSNAGEYFYASVPTSLSPGFGDPNSRDSWLRLIRATVIHEVKHVTAFAERISRGLPLEEMAWEEGMARNVEELYARTFYGTQARQNTGYAASIACEALYVQTPVPPESCTGRPLLVYRHFDALYQYLATPELLSPLGQTFNSDATFYGSVWSILRWADDNFAQSEPQFLHDFTVSPVTGVPNLEARTGHAWEESLGEWSLAMYLDDMPGFTPANARLAMPSWNLHDIFQGMCNVLGPCLSANNTSQIYPRASPFQARTALFGNFSFSVDGVAGGSFSVFDVNGPQSGTQLFELRSSAGGDPPPTFRIAIVRVQ